MENNFKKFIQKIEYNLPMSFGSLLIFIFIMYSFYIVGRSIYVSYNSNKSIIKEEAKIDQLESKIYQMKNEINYYQTSSYKEKQAREKLIYKAPGESVINLPVDTETEKLADPELGEVVLKTPNYAYWIKYFKGEEE